MNKHSKIYVAGHTGLVGSAIMRYLTKNGYTTIVTKTVQELDLRNQHAVEDFFSLEKPDYVFLAAAKVGGIQANASFPASFIYDNLMIETHVIHACFMHKVKKLLFLGSSCIYPRMCPQPIREDYILTGALEKTNEAYAIAKIAGLIMCQSYNRQYGTCFISCMPTNLYGPYDNFDLESSHVIPALIAKIDKAKQEKSPKVMLWGTGTPRREFLYVDDLSEALVFLMNTYHESMPINVGTGEDISIAELAERIKTIIGYQGDIVFNHNYLDGTPQKRLDCTNINKLGWKATTALREGLEKTYAWYKHRV